MPDTIGWTGSREMTPEMQGFIDRAVDAFEDNAIIVTGACIGVDAYVARAAFLRGLLVHTIVPANRRYVDPHWRAHCTTYTEMEKGTTYLARNRAIVRMADRLYGVPRWPEAHTKSRRSGTWQTIRLAYNLGKPCYVYIK